MEPKKILNFFFELKQLSLQSRSGWRLIQKSEPEKISDHNLRAAQIGYVLAKLENHPAPEHVAALLVFHEIGECRIGDVDKVMRRYVTADEQAAVTDQTAPLGEVGKNILVLWQEFEGRMTPAAKIAKDADYLELIVSAKEYIEQGHVYAKDWMDNASRALVTASAQRLARELGETHSSDWWQGLKKIG